MKYRLALLGVIVMLGACTTTPQIGIGAVQNVGAKDAWLYRYDDKARISSIEVVGTNYGKAVQQQWHGDECWLLVNNEVVRPPYNIRILE